VRVDRLDRLMNDAYDRIEIGCIGFPDQHCGSSCLAGFLMRYYKERRGKPSRTPA
jgi:hypothetical protein